LKEGGREGERNGREGVLDDLLRLGLG